MALVYEDDDSSDEGVLTVVGNQTEDVESSQRTLVSMYTRP